MGAFVVATLALLAYMVFHVHFPHLDWRFGWGHRDHYTTHRQRGGNALGGLGLGINTYINTGGRRVVYLRQFAR